MSYKGLISPICKKFIQTKGKKSPHHGDHGHNGVAETKLLSHLKKNEKPGKYMKEWFSDTGPQAAQGKIPERSKTNEVMPLMAPPYCLERVSRPQQREGERKQSQAVSTELKDRVRT